MSRPLLNETSHKKIIKAFSISVHSLNEGYQIIYAMSFNIVEINIDCTLGNVL